MSGFGEEEFRPVTRHFVSWHLFWPVLLPLGSASTRPAPGGALPSSPSPADLCARVFGIFVQRLKMVQNTPIPKGAEPNFSRQEGTLCQLSSQAWWLQEYGENQALGWDKCIFL